MGPGVDAEASPDLPRAAGHPFYERLNQTAGFDAFVEGLCAPFYARRPSLAPDRYFRLLFVGYFEGLDSERAIAWRAVDSLSLRSCCISRRRHRLRTTRRPRERGGC